MNISWTRPRLAGIHYACIQLLYWAAMAVYFAFGAAYLFDRGLSAWTAGLVFAAAGVVSAAAQPLIAGYADRARKTGTVRRLCLMLTAPACLLLGVLWLVPMALSWHIVLYTFAWMLLMTVLFLFNSLAMEYPNAGFTLNYGAGRAMGSFGFAIAAYLYGRYAAKAGTAALLPVGFVLSLLLFAALFFWRCPPLVLPDARAARESDAGFFRRYPRFLLLVIGTVLCMTPYSMVCSFLVRIISSVGGGSVELGTATMLCALCEIPVMFLSVWLIRRCGAYALMIVAAAMLSVKMLLFTLAGTVSTVYIAELAQLLGYPLLMCTSVYYVNALMAPRDRVRGQALMALTQTLASAIGALLGGLLIDGLGVQGLLYISLVVSCAGSVMMILSLQRVDTRGDRVVSQDNIFN